MKGGGIQKVQIFIIVHQKFFYLKKSIFPVTIIIDIL